MALTEPEPPTSRQRREKGKSGELEDASSQSDPVAKDGTPDEAAAPDGVAISDLSQKSLGGLMRERMVDCDDGRDFDFLPRTELQNLLPEQTMTMALSKLSVSIPLGGVKRIQKLLAVLILTQKLETITDFVTEGIDDSHLPFYHTKGSNDTMRTLKRKDSKDQLIPIQSFSKWDDVAIDSFYNQQWKVWVPVFNINEDKSKTPPHWEFPTRTILPFIKREKKGAGGQSTVHGVEIHSGHHDGSKEPVQMYAVKVLKNASEETFREEVSNLHRFSTHGKEHPHLIRLLWTYQHGTEYHLVFPRATGNLMELWKENMEPLAKRQDPAAALWFARQLLGIAEGLRTIHWYDNTNSSQSETQRHGRHGDLKPENILWFKDLQNQEEGYSLGVLKISDFGLAKFHRTCSVREEVKNGVGVSPTYRAPEYSIVGEVAQNYDVWSLACVFLEFITWYLNGPERVAQFTQSREKEEDGNQRVRRLADPPGFTEDKFFIYVTIDGRDGRRLTGAQAKRSVANEIANLYKHPYGSDFTDDLLDFVQTKMLRMHSSERTSCTNIRDKMQELYDNCRNNHLYSQKRLNPISERNNTKLSLLEPVVVDLPPRRDVASNIRDFDSSSGFSSRRSSVMSQTSEKRNSVSWWSLGTELCYLYSTFRLLLRRPTMAAPEIHVVTEDPAGNSLVVTSPKFPFLYPKVRGLQIKARVFDKIKAIIPPCAEPQVASFASDSGNENPRLRLKRIYETTYLQSKRMIRFFHEIRLLADPRLDRHDEITSGDSFDAFWRALIYDWANDDPNVEQSAPKWIGISFGYYYLFLKLGLTRGWEKTPSSFDLHVSALSGLMLPFAKAFERMLGRSFFVSESGRMGWAPLATCPGDSIGIFLGNRIPFVAKSAGIDSWQYVGGCYIHGGMNGELWDAEESEWQSEMFI